MRLRSAILTVVLLTTLFQRWSRVHQVLNSAEATDMPALSSRSSRKIIPGSPESAMLPRSGMELSRFGTLFAVIIIAAASYAAQAPTPGYDQLASFSNNSGPAAPFGSL
jgi:hypothetical protein